MIEDLPGGWQEAELPAVAELNMGQSPPSNTYNTKGSGLPFFQGKMEFGKIYPSPVKYCSQPAKIAEVGDILISVRAPVGPTNLCRERSCIGRGLAAIRPIGDIPSRYLLYYLRNIEPWLSRQGTGSTFTAISKSDLEQLTLPVAPLVEQRRIVAKLEKLVGQVDACQQRLARIPGLLKRFRQAVLAAACSGRLTADLRDADDDPDELPQSWSLVDFGSLIADGPQNGLYKPQSCYGSGTPIVRIDAFYDGKITNWAELKRLRVTKKELEQFTLAEGDILINRVNSPKFLGKSALVQGMPELSIYESNMMRLRLDGSRVKPGYAVLYLRSAGGLEELRKNAKHAVNQSSINQEDVKGALFVLPPLPEQKEIVRRVEEMFALADRIEVRFAEGQKRVDSITQAILAKAFRGELVPTEYELAKAEGRSFESAEELLERIRKNGGRPTKKK